MDEISHAASRAAERAPAVENMQGIEILVEEKWIVDILRSFLSLWNTGKGCSLSLEDLNSSVFLGDGAESTGSGSPPNGTWIALAEVRLLLQHHYDL